jgi:hypothetical protein
MGENRKPAIATILAGLLIVVVLLGTYVGGYFWLCERVVPQPPASVIGVTRTSIRIYARQWQAELFAPAAQVETWLWGDKTVTDVDKRINF